MKIKPHYPSDLLEAVKPLSLHPGVEADIVPPSDKGIYAVADLMKLAPARLQQKHESLLKPKTEVTVTEVKEGSDQGSTTLSTNAELETEATYGKDEQAPEVPTESTADQTAEASKDTNKFATVEEILEDDAAADTDAKATQGVFNGAHPFAIGGPAEKKKKRSRAYRADGTKKIKPPKATGFEEFYAEGPIAPDVWEEEQNSTYHHTHPFDERIEAAIVRYKEKRKLNSERGDMLNKFLTLGGIDTTIKQFQSADHCGKKDDDDDLGVDSDGLSIYNISGNATPMESVFDGSQGAVSKHYNPFAPQNWTVDWQGCAKAYLSSRAPYLFGISDDDKIDAYCEVVVNFCNYVLLHSAAPEYTNDILETQKIARQAKKELRKVYILGDTFPGPLHRALSCLANGSQKPLYLFSEEQAAEKMAMEHDDYEEFTENKCLTIAKCKSTIQAAIQILGTPEQIKLLAELKEGDDIKVIKEETCNFEVIGIQFPTEEQVKEFEDMKFESGPVQPMGFIYVKPWINPIYDAPEDLTPAEARAKSRREAKAEKARLQRLRDGIPESEDTPTESFIISTHILENIFMGMKFEAVVKEVTGMRFMDELKGAYCSFFEVTQNMKMDGWREPKKTDRDPPTCNDVNGQAQNGEADSEENSKVED